jgi:hypothetical protein
MNPRLVLAAFLLLLAGCATTSADRIAQNRSTFDSWPAEVQGKIRAGQVALGFSEEQVLMALGDPDRTIARTTEQGTAIVWAYSHRGPQVSFGLGMAGGSGHTGYGAGVAINDRPYFNGDAMHVVFMDHKLVSIETTKTP